MRNRRFAVSLALLIAGLPSSSGAAEESNFVREAMTVESHKLVGDKATRTLETLPQIVDVAVYRPDDGLKHPAIVYLHGGGMSFADTSMQRFHIELARRGLVVLAPHYLLNGTGWPHWHETAVNTVTLAASLPSVDPESIGMAGISMGGQIGLSTAARDPRIKAVAEFFTAWPGSLPDEPIDKLPPVLLLNGTADPIIPFDVALVLDDILTAHHLPFERHVYEGLGHGFSTAASFDDGVKRTAAFFGGRVDGPGPAPSSVEIGISNAGQPGSTNQGFFDLSDDFGFFEWQASNATRWATIVPKKKPKRLLVRKSAKTPSAATRSSAARQ